MIGQLRRIIEKDLVIQYVLVRTAFSWYHACNKVRNSPPKVYESLICSLSHGPNG